MTNDLLQLKDLAPPMGDLAAARGLAATRALWTAPLAHETGLPESRIIHARALQLHGAARLDRLGLRTAPGYHKCGSRQDPDWVTAFRLLTFYAGEWRTTLAQSDLPRPTEGMTHWFDLGGLTAEGVLIELRGSGTDEGWTPWNLAEGACVLEGELLTPLAPRCERALELSGVDLKNLPTGIAARHANGEVRFETNTFAVGFYLSRPGFSFLSLTGEDPTLAEHNTLFLRPGAFWQGPRLHAVGAAPAMDTAVRFNATGTTTVKDNTITYDFTSDGQHYTLGWTVTPRGLRLHARRVSETTRQVWQSSAWTLALRNSVAPSHTLGRLLPSGETGGVALPAILHLPRFGSLRLTADSAQVTLRTDVFRSLDCNTVELKLGEERLANGTYLLPAGLFEATIELTPVTPPALLRADAPEAARLALARTAYTALTYRPDMGTLSNNGASMPCAICMDTWSSFIFALGEIVPGLDAAELLRTSLERWLDGGQSYAGGRLLQDGKLHEAEDEYLMTGAAGLRGLADYLAHRATPEWFALRLPRIRARLAAMRARDLDGDGLIESAWRTGVSGTGQWSTCWFDVVSFGWKDAFANAILYPALRSLAATFAQHDLAEEAAALTAWADRLEENYLPTFHNPATGWIAGWRCKADQLHDYAFLAVNGAAITAGLVPLPLARDICERLLHEMAHVAVPAATHGLPGNLRPIPDSDLADIMQGYPMGYYQNGGRTHAQTRHFVMALYRCGLDAPADRILLELCTGLAEAQVFGGNQSGVDWRGWDDRPCGYEGLLTDQFGVLEAVFHRYGQAAPRPAAPRSATHTLSR
ncbi:MAG: hypothetical protein KA257_01795 [Opitutaceae bacterium]|jgi:hypothetical protein|nr:hypothetical protein [Opitutaceae bacterium]MBP9911942.1 hypothetical protein [Opitutaceae bacterium]